MTKRNDRINAWTPAPVAHVANGAQEGHAHRVFRPNALSAIRARGLTSEQHCRNQLGALRPRNETVTFPMTLLFKQPFNPTKHNTHLGRSTSPWHWWSTKAFSAFLW